MTIGSITKEGYADILPVLPAPVQSPSMLMNKREESYRLSTTIDSSRLPPTIETTSTKPKGSKKLNRLSQLTSRQQFQYETTKQMVVMSNEIDFLTKKLLVAEEKVYKWKKEFKELHIHFMQATEETTKVKEELETTRRMLEESEHIRSRWFIKKPHAMPESCSSCTGRNNCKKSPPQHQRYISLLDHPDCINNKLLYFLVYLITCYVF